MERPRWSGRRKPRSRSAKSSRSPSEDKALTSDGLKLVNFRPSEVKFGGGAGVPTEPTLC